MLLVVALVVLQTTLFPSLRVFGATPSLCLVATVAMAYELGPRPALVFGFLSGLFMDMFLEKPAGLSALSFALAGYAIGMFQQGFVRESRSIGPILGAIGGLVGGTIFTIVGGIAGKDGYFSLNSVKLIVVGALYDALLALAIFPFVSWANRDADLGPARFGR